MSIDAARLDGIGDGQGIGRRASKDFGPQVLHQGDLPGCVANRRGDHREAQPLRAGMKSEAASKEAVTIGVLKDLPRSGSCRGQTASANFRPGFQIASRVTDDGRFSSRAAGSMDSYQLPSRDSEKPERVMFLQVGFVGARQAMKVCPAANGVRSNAAGIERLLVKRHALVEPPDQLGEAPRLERFELRTGHGLDRLVPYHRSRSRLSL